MFLVPSPHDLDRERVHDRIKISIDHAHVYGQGHGGWKNLFGIIGMKKGFKVYLQSRPKLYRNP